MTFYRKKLSANSSRYLCLVLFAVVVVVVVVGIVKLAALSLVFNLKYCWLVLANYSPLKLIIFHYLPEGTCPLGGCVGGRMGHHFPILIDSCGAIAGLAVIRGSCVRGSSSSLRCDTFAATPPTTTLTIAAKTKLCFRCTNTHTHAHMQSSSYCASFAARRRSETDCPTAITRMHSLHASPAPS